MKTKAKGRISLVPGHSETTSVSRFRWSLRTVESVPQYTITGGDAFGQYSDTITGAKVAGQKAAYFFGLEIVDWDGIKEREVSDETLPNKTQDAVKEDERQDPHPEAKGHCETG